MIMNQPTLPIHHRAQTSRNPPCPKCNARTWSRGRRKGYQRFTCTRCQYYFRQIGELNTRPNDNPPCPYCNGNSQLRRRNHGNPGYLCQQCNRYFQHSYRSNSNPPCPLCQGKSQRRGRREGKQVCFCVACHRYFRCTLQQQRQHEVRQQAEQLPALIDQKLPKTLPVEIRQELQQELVMAALSGEFELSELEQVITLYRRKVYRESLTGFGYISLDAVIPHTEGLTLADTLAG